MRVACDLVELEEYAEYLDLKRIEVQEGCEVV